MFIKLPWCIFNTDDIISVSKIFHSFIGPNPKYYILIQLKNTFGNAVTVSSQLYNENIADQILEKISIYIQAKEI